jgi:hypothetical protein
MAEISIPAPDTAGYWHFTYITTDAFNGRWYGGKRSTKKHPLSDRYLGSGNWIKKHPARERLRREIVAFYATSAEVFAAEARMITMTVVLGDPLCMNLCDGGDGLTVESALRIAADPAWLEATIAATRRTTRTSAWKKAHAVGIANRGDNATWLANVSAAAQLTMNDPKWKEAQTAGSRRRTATPEWSEGNTAKNRRIAADPTYRAAFLAGIARRSADPTWKANNAAANRRNGAARHAAKALLLAGAR